MFRDKARFGQDPNVVVRSATTFDAPLRWKKPRMVFTCSWSDWFIEEADAWRDDAYAVIRATPHVYQILTKRIERAAGRLPDPPLLNAWLGVSIEDRDHMERLEILRSTPAALRFLSLEPLLEDLGAIELSGIGWVIVGGESGSGARACNPAWIGNIIRQCKAARVPCFVKQLGARVMVDYFSRSHEVGDWARSMPHTVLEYGVVWNGVSVPTPGATYAHVKLKDVKGGDPVEWPDSLCVRQRPSA